MKPFRFKQFSVSHERSAMKVGTDGVLLGAWAFKNESESTGVGLDVGCGCGVITLMMAQRFPEMHWQGIELHPEAALEAKSNFKNSPFNQRLDLIQGDFLAQTNLPKWDKIICNPPYFQDALESQNEGRNMARQERFLQPDFFLQQAWKCSQNSGKLAVILPLDRLRHWKNTASLVGWKLSRESAVKGHAAIQANRYLLEWNKFHTLGPEFEELILEENRGTKTTEYHQLTESFYL